MMYKVALMFLMFYMPSLVAQTPCPVKDCACLLKKAHAYAQDPAALDAALNQYFAATACDEGLRTQAEAGIEALFEQIEQLRQEEAEAQKVAQRTALQAKRELHMAIQEEQQSDSLYQLAQAEQRKNQRIIDQFYFYAGRFALTVKKPYGKDIYGYIDKEGRQVIPFKYEAALPFDDSGFAKVKRDEVNYLIDTLGREYPVAYAIENLTPELLALDLRGRELDRIPDGVFAFPQLEVVLLGGNKLKELPRELGQLKNLRVLDLSRNQITSLPSILVEMAQLKSLRLVNNPIDSDLIETLSKKMPWCSIVLSAY